MTLLSLGAAALLAGENGAAVQELLHVEGSSAVFFIGFAKSGNLGLLIIIPLESVSRDNA
jgi:hypothetical protein